jgi:aminomethyltransferase
MRGKVKRRLAVLRLKGGAVPAAGSAVLDRSSAPVGETRSAASSTVFGAPVALAFVGAAAAAPGTELLVGGAEAIVVDPQ